MNQYQRDFLTVPWDRTKELELFMKSFFGAYAVWALDGYGSRGVFRDSKSLREALHLYCQQFAPYLYEEAKEFIFFLMHQAKMNLSDPFEDLGFDLNVRRAHRFDGSIQRNPKILTFVIAQLTEEQYTNICGNPFEKVRQRREMMNFAMGAIAFKPFNRNKP